jgi:hypothetical protein
MILKLPKRKAEKKPKLPNKVDMTKLWKYERLVDGEWQPVDKNDIENGDVFRVFDQKGQPESNGKAFLCLDALWYTSETKKWDIKAVPYSARFFMGNYKRPGADDVEQAD